MAEWKEKIRKNGEKMREVIAVRQQMLREATTKEKKQRKEKEREQEKGKEKTKMDQKAGTAASGEEEK